MIQTTGVQFDKQLEMVILGAILLERDAISRAMPLFRPQLFYVGQHEITATAIWNLYKKGTPIDTVTVFTEIKSMGKLEAVTPNDILELQNAVVSSAHLEAHMAKLAELFLAREVQRLAGKAFSDAGDASADVFETISELQNALLSLTAGTMQGGLISYDRLVTATLRYIDSIGTESIVGVPVGVKEMDAILNGFKPEDLIILAARPACGKTAMALQIRREAAKQDIQSGLFSLEMSSKQLVQRDLAAESGVPFARIQRNQMEPWQKELVVAAAGRLAALPMYTDDSFAQNVEVLKAKCVQMKFRHGLGLVVVDYLQLIGSKKGRGQSREQEISEISRGLKGIAKELQVPVIALSQMSRDIEKSGRTEPVLADLRESGAIEQDADAVIFLTPEDQAPDEIGQPKRVKAKIAKHRNGGTGTVELLFEGNFQRFKGTESAPF